MIHKKVTIHGRVQGVNYRNSARKKAQELGLAGWVRNEPDGTVYAEVEGLKEDVHTFIQWCESGSPWANVKKVYVEEGEPQDYNTFEIKR